MGCLGVHFALTEQEVAHLRAFDDEQDRLSHLQNVIEPNYLTSSKPFAAESDKAWDAIHRVLSDGELSWDGGDYPLNHTVLGGEPLYMEDDYIMSLKTPDQVREIAAALKDLTEAEFRRRYLAIDATSYERTHHGPSEEDFDYTWYWLQVVRELYIRAAEAGRYVLFTADQ